MTFSLLLDFYRNFKVLSDKISANLSESMGDGEEVPGCVRDDIFDESIFLIIRIIYWDIHQSV
jgi:hypothetical protein